MLKSHLHAGVLCHLSSTEQCLWDQACGNPQPAFPDWRIAVSEVELTESILELLVAQYGTHHLFRVPLVKRASLDVLRTPIAAKIMTCSPIHRNSTLGVCALVRCRSPDVLQYLHETYQLFREDDIYELFEMALSNNDVPALQWLYTTFSEDKVKPITSNILGMAIAANSIPGLEWLYTLPWNVQCNTDKACSAAIAHDHVEALHWLRNPNTGYGAYPWDRYLCLREAIACNSLKTAHWIENNTLIVN